MDADAAWWAEWLDGWTHELRATGPLGAPGASDAELRALEARLGVALPPSYRAFLQASDGFLQPGMIVPCLLPAREVDWYRTAHRDTIDAWASGAGADDPVVATLEASLLVSAEETSGSAVYLLDPRDVGADGEWAALYFAHWVPGVDRYASFRALMEHERASLATPPPPRRSGWRTALDVLRWIVRRD